ncbi:MAG: glycosyltransferase [Clostridia bacterium]|nr:glycosyltransferase [Clostridia bacterium]
MQEKLISVIVPVYNVEKYLSECVDSILRQTYQNLEVILVDDGSTDNSGAICDEYAKKDSRIKVFHKENGGLSSARNYGLDRMHGDYVAFVDSDDYIADTMYEELIKKCLEYGADITACGFTRFYEDGKEEHRYAFFEGECFIGKDFDRLADYGPYKDLVVVAWNKLYKSCVFNQIRYPAGKLHEDEFIIFDLLGKIKKFVFLYKSLYRYRVRENSITSTFNLNRLDGVEAALIQCDRAFERKNYESAKKQFDSVFRYYRSIISNTEIKTKSDKKRALKIKRMLRKNFNKQDKKMFPFKERISLTLYFLSPRI